ncbi:MAG: DinB family protein [Bacteroidota bacterium]
MALNKEFLQHQLQRSAEDFIKIILSLTEQQCEQNLKGKWSAGQDLAHLTKTLRVIGLGFRLPLGIFKLLYGTANRPSRVYEEFSARYEEKMEGGIQAPSYVLPPKVSYGDRDKLRNKLMKQTAFLVRKAEAMSEQDLDRYIVPHPLFGKITMREMFMATWLHTDHHTALLKRKLG